MANDIILNDKQNFDLSIFEIIDGKINLTKICKYFGKEIYDWTRLKNTKEFISAFEAEPQINGSAFISLKGGNGEQGTFTEHREVAIELARWISPKFAVWANRQIDTLLQTGKVELIKQDLPSYQIENPIERAKKWIKEQEEKEALKLESKQKDEHIVNLGKDVQETRLALAKQYKTVDARNKADIGKAINDLVLKHFKKEDMLYPDAHKASWEAYLFATGVHYPGAVKATYEQKLSFLNFLTTL